MLARTRECRSRWRKARRKRSDINGLAAENASAIRQVGHDRRRTEGGCIP